MSVTAIALAAAVAHLSLIQGGIVSVTHADGTTVADATEGMPLVPGDRIVVAGAQARAEIWLDDRSAVRSQGETALRVLGARHVALDSGLFAVALVRGGVTVIADAPGVRATSSYAGVYRIDVKPGATAIAVRQGQLGIDAGARHATLLAGASFGEAAVPPRDAFDDFNAVRDGELVAALDGTRADSAGGDDGRWDLPAHVDRLLSSQLGPSLLGANARSWIPYGFGNWVFTPGSGWYWMPSTQIGVTWGTPQFVPYVPAAHASFSGVRTVAPASLRGVVLPSISRSGTRPARSAVPVRRFVAKPPE